ncbi:hypothetical protein [Brassicibacter mesophilus]|uniref:hypothetical protein n=1 Tax=Brassicibacter mesophilus TaxID=745119 RepID=UPI003D1DCD2F
MTNMHSLNNYPSWFWTITLPLLALILFGQALWIFRDAQKRGIFPWFWGFWGLLQFPTPLIFYYFFVVRKNKQKGKERGNKEC